jgi:putative glycosyltransferase (TIGR04372 family)
LIQEYSTAAYELYIPPAYFLHNRINNFFRSQKNKIDVRGVTERSIRDTLPEKYAVINIRCSPNDPINRNTDEEMLLKSVDYLGANGIKCILLGNSTGKLLHPNLMRLSNSNTWGTIHDLEILANAEIMIASPSGPAAWAELLQVPLVIVGSPLPLLNSIFHESPSTFILPKSVDTTEFQNPNNLLLNIEDILEVGILGWARSSLICRIQKLLLTNQFYSCRTLRYNSDDEILKAVIYAYERLSQSNREDNQYSTEKQLIFHSLRTSLGLKGRPNLIDLRETNGTN